MDPKSPHASSPGGAGRTDAPKAKRARLRYLNNNHNNNHNDDDDGEQRRRPTFKSSNGQIICLHRGTCSTTTGSSGADNLVLPIDLLASSLLYLDLGDLSAALAVCKDWRKALQSVEDELWLGWVRKHCPSVEEITNLLELSPKKELPAGCNGNTGTGTTSGIPSPSKNWRRQFQRHLLLSQPDRSAASAAAVEKPPPKPLSAYLFKVDLVLYQKKEGVAGKGDQVGLVSRVFPDAKFKSNENVLRFTFDGLHDDMKNYTFSSFDFRIIIFDKGTGRQALIHSSGIEDIWEMNVWASDCCPLKSAYLLEDLVFPNEDIENMLLVSKTGCASRCKHDWDFYGMPTCRGCCNCDAKWSCFWDMEIDLRIAAFFDWNSVDLNEAQQLRFFEEHIEFK